MRDTRSEVVKDVHTEHCCWRHGCKYHWAGRRSTSCSVVSGEKSQSFMCEMCADELEDSWDDILAMNAVFNAGRRATAREVLAATDGGPEHPWIPGAAFARSGLYAKLTRWAEVPDE